MDIAHLLFSFQGRIRRLHYWMSAICTAVAVTVLIVVILSVAGMASGHVSPAVALIVLPLNAAYIWIALALGVKRCHDRNKSGWWLAIFMVVSITGIGALWPLIELGFLDGTQGPNQYGPSPKGIVGPEAVAA
jgi:uncharacterized membrane protein YhaH (DUF805 family)